MVRRKALVCCTLLLLLQTSISSATNSTGTSFYLSYFGPAYGFFRTASAVLVGWDTITKRGLLPGFSLQPVFVDAGICKPSTALRKFILLDNRTSLDVVIGDFCSSTCEALALVTGSMDLPTVSYACISDKLSNRKLYPTFFRTTEQSLGVAYPLYQTIQTFNWKHISIIADADDNTKKDMIYILKELLEAYGGSVIYRVVSSTVQENTFIQKNIDTLRLILQEYKNTTRVILSLMRNDDTCNVLTVAYEEGMLNEEFAFIGVDSGPYASQTYRQELSKTLLYEGFIGVYLSTFEPPGFEQFKRDAVEAFKSPLLVNYEKPKNLTDIQAFAGLVHDAVLLWGYAVNKTIQQGFSPHDGLKVTRNIVNMSFEGVTGPVFIDELGNRKSNYIVQMVQNAEMIVIMEWIAAGYMKKVYKPEDPNDWSGLVWPGNGTKPPRDVPECGWENEICDRKERKHHVTIISSMTIISLAIATLAIGISFRRYFTELKLHGATSCLVTWSDVAVTGMGRAPSVVSDMTTHSFNTGTNTMRSTIFSGTVIYKNERAAILKLGSKPVVVGNRQILMELQAMKQVHHENICRFVGVCLEPGHECILMAHASRGSLQDILAYSETPITWDLKVSIINDIAMGMKYLHESPIGSHGHLASYNCIIDQRWVCKITDYGLGFLKESSNTAVQDENVQCLLWTAPEILRLVTRPYRGSKTGDVYAFGIILQEIITADLPFQLSNLDMDEAGVIEKVKAGEVPAFRPHVPQDSAENKWWSIAVQCWNECPEDRPSFQTIIRELSHSNDGKGFSLVDNMINRLENHTQNLEEVVARRTLELHEEKEKMEFLLQELLPISVYKDLKMGRQVAPEMFNDVTIFFSDMVGFTRVSAASTPMQVVKMLNLMYTLFDGVSANYDVYKVATIGDAYFVASGVPIRNGNLHAGEICGLALALLEAISSFSIPHLPGEMLRMRIGIHSGSCVAGVAGIKMPRYLLFGDTVDIASHMESGGESMRIHISQATLDVLSITGGFHTEIRGYTDIKGLGNTLTHWLLK